MAIRDGYSNFSFLQGLPPQDVAAGAATNGNTIDTQGYETVTFVVNIGGYTGGGAFSADNRFQLKLEHALESAAGAASTWSECYPSEIIHSVVGEAGAYSTLNSGIWASITSADVNTVQVVGYTGTRRLVRVVISEVGAPSTMSFGIIAILGLPANWPVRTPVNS